jgi:hypothetical protein
MHGCTSARLGSSVGPLTGSASTGAEHGRSPATAGQPLAGGLRARRPRGLDVVRRGQDRAPPGSRWPLRGHELQFRARHP